MLAVPEAGEMPVILVAPLIFLKLLAGRPQDLADVHAFLRAGADLAQVRAYLDTHAPDLIPVLAQFVP